MNKWKKPKNRSVFHLYGKTGENFPPNGTVQFSSVFHLYGKTVVPLGNQTEWFFPLAISGNKPRISPRNMVRNDIPVISVKTRKEEFVCKLFLFSEKFLVGRTVPFVVLPERKALQLLDRLDTLNLAKL